MHRRRRARRQGARPDGGHAITSLVIVDDGGRPDRRDPPPRTSCAPRSSDARAPRPPARAVAASVSRARRGRRAHRRRPRTTASGEETKRFHVHDGLAMAAARRAGLAIAVISGRASAAVTPAHGRARGRRGAPGRRRQGGALDALLDAARLEAAEVAMMGDDLPDLPLMERAGAGAWRRQRGGRGEARRALGGAPAGRRGAVREAVEMLLKARRAWPPAPRAREAIFVCHYSHSVLAWHRVAMRKAPFIILTLVVVFLSVVVGVLVHRARTPRAIPTEPAATNADYRLKQVRLQETSRDGSRWRASRMLRTPRSGTRRR